MKLPSLAALFSLAAVAVFSFYLAIANVAPEGDDFVALETGKDLPEAKTPTEMRRAPDQTFLTFPEWFLVFSPAEYSDYLADGAPSGFPFFRHIGQFWQSYAKVARLTRRYFAFNGEYHVMIAVIGVSMTVEYFVKGTYETLVGRLTEIASYRTAEDRVAAATAKRYVEFINVEPWYKFDFLASLKSVWTGTGLFGTAMLRKLERKYLLSTEYLVKAVYGFLIAKATASAFDVPVSTTAVVTAGDVPIPAKAGVAKLKTFPNGSVLWTLPRYAAFTDESLAFAKAGAEFQEVAGNRGTILVSILGPTSWRPRSPSFDVLFTQPIVTKADLKRLALIVPIKNLGAVLRELSTPPLRVEHVFDF